VRSFAKDLNAQRNVIIDYKSNHVSLLSEDERLFDKGVLDVNSTKKMVLNIVKLFPNEVVVQVTHEWEQSH
jgi:hypothetical protein